MTLPDADTTHKGHYLGTEINEKWWKRYKKNRFFARGNGEYWVDDQALYFRRYLTRHPIIIPFEKMIEIKIGKSHAGRWVFGLRALKLVWEEDGIRLSSGFVFCRNQPETMAVMTDLKRRCGLA